MESRRARPRRSDSTNRVSGEPGAVHSTINTLARQCGEQLAYGIDDQILNATAAGGAGGTSFTGGVVEDAAEVTEAVAGTVGYADVLKLYYALTPPYNDDAVFLAPPGVMQLIGGIRATGGSPIFEGLVNPPQPIGDGSGQFPMLYGRPALVMNQLSSGTLLLGSFGGYAVMQREGIRVEVSRDYAFNTDQVAFRFAWRGDGDVQNAARFKKMLGLATAGT